MMISTKKVIQTSSCSKVWRTLEEGLLFVKVGPEQGLPGAQQDHGDYYRILQRQVEETPKGSTARDY